MRILSFPLLFGFLIACTPSQVPIQEIIAFENLNDSYEANQEFNEIQVRISEEADWNRRTLVFTCSPPAEFSNGTQEIEVQADENTFLATTQIKSGTKGPVLLTAYPKGLEANYTIEQEILFISPSIFTVVAPSSDIPADNYQTHELKVQLQPNLNFDGEKITFETDRGTFANGSTKVELFPRPDSVAIAYLKHSLPETATVSISAKGQTQTVSAPFRPVQASDLLMIEADMSALTADDVTERLIKLDVFRPTQAEETIRVETQSGTLRYAGNKESVLDITAQTPGDLDLFLTTNQTSNVNVTARYLNQAQSLSIPTIAANPEAISLVPADNLYTLKALEIKSVKAILTRNMGFVSPGTVVNFQISDPNLTLVKQTTASRTEDEVAAIVEFYYGTAVSDTTLISLQATSNLAPPATLQLRVIP